VVRECKSDKSWLKIKYVAQVSRFGNKVNRVVLEALHTYNITTNDVGLNAAASLEMASNASIAINCNGGSSEPNVVAAPTGTDPRSLPPEVIFPAWALQGRVGPVDCQIQAQPQAEHVQLLDR
jgi:hypothetical protein